MWKCIKKQNPLVLIGHLFFFIYIFLCLIYYKERVCFYDSAFHLFKIIHFKSYIIEASRYSSFLPQTIVLLGLKIGLSLKLMIALYSVSYPLVFYVLFLITVYVFKQVPVAIIMLLALALGQLNVFFCPIADTHQTLVYCAFFYGWLNFQVKINVLLKTFVSIFLLLLCLFSHPVAVFVLLFIVFYQYSIFERPYKKPIFFIAVIIIFMVMKVYFTPEGSYEGSFFSNIINYKQAFTNGILTLYPLNFIYKHFFSTYLLPTIIGIFSLYFLVKNKNYYKSLVLVAFTVSLFIISLISYYMGDADVQMERTFMPIIFFGFFPLSEFLASEKLKIWIKSTILILVLAFGLIQIIKISDYYSYRISKLYELFDRSKSNEGRKFILSQDDMKDFPTLTWSLSFETLLLSSLNNPDDARTFYVVSDDFNLDKVQDQKLFLGAPFWPVWSTSEFNTNYFKLEEGFYQRMKP